MKYHIIMLFGALWLVSCATPIAPTGGPADTTAPEVVFMKPETGTTNFKEDRFEFGFSEYVNRSNFTRSFTVEPDLGIPYDVKWKQKKVIVRFKEALPEATTIILTVGTELTDMHNNKLGAPVKLAISTGDEIDSGEITGRINNAADGKPRVGQRVLLYRYPADFNEKAAYSSETDTAGIFNFKYLSEGRYQAIMLDDRNRNKIWEQDRETARPFFRESFELEKGKIDTISTAFWFEADTVKPVLQAVGLLSSQKLRLRFSKEITFTESTAIQVTDTLGNAFSEVLPLNISEKDRFIAFGFSPEPLAAENSYKIEIQGITDFNGNEAAGLKSSFMGNNRADTTAQRIIASNEELGLFSRQAFMAEYAAPITDPDILDSVVVVEGDVSFDDWPGITFEQNRIIIPPQESWIEGVDYQFLLWEPSRMKRRLFKPETWDPVDFGGIEVNIDAKEDSLKSYRLEILSEHEVIHIDTVFSGSFLLDGIPPLSYSVRVFEDENGNGSWDYGSIIPFAAPEPYFFRKDIKVQKGFTTDIPVRF